MKMHITFAEHIPQTQIGGMVSSMAAYGEVLPQSAERSFVVEVFRASKATGLRELLTGWDLHGFIRWSEA
jgi:hypothetical protein